MNRSSFALLVALLIHFLLLLLFWLLGTITPEIKKPLQNKEKKIKVSLKEMPEKFKDSGEVKKVVKPPLDIAPPMPKGRQLKEIVKPAEKTPIKYKPKEDTKQMPTPLNQAKHEPKAEPRPKVENLPPVKPYMVLEPAKEKVKEKKADPLAWMHEDKSAEEVKSDKSKVASGSSINSDIKELYGDEFGKLTPGQQEYIIDNQEIMRRITQEVLNRVARVNLTRDINVNRVNIIEFYLHPNGDMSDFKFLKTSGYYVLDDTTRETIEFSYSKYPRPKEKILIRYNVFYNLARY